MEILRHLKPAIKVCVRGYKRWFSGIGMYPGKKIDVEGISLHYEQIGDGPHKVLLIPGALGSGRTDFTPQLEQLDKSKFTLVAWDPPGYGYSRPPDRTFPRDFFHRDAHLAAKTMAKLGHKNYSALGWSDGGTTTLIIAAHYPNAVEKIIVWGSTAHFTQKDVELLNPLKDISKWSKKMLEPMLALYQETYFSKMWLDYTDAAERIVADGGDLCREDLNKIVCPTLIVHGDKDPLVPSEYPSYLLEHIKKSRLHRIPEGKHNIHLRYAKEFNELVTEFLLQQQ